MKAIVIVYGGIVDGVLVSDLVKKGYEVRLLSFIFESSHPNNIEAIKKLADHYNLELHEINVGDFSFLFDDYITRNLTKVAFAIALAKQTKSDIYLPAFTSEENKAFPASLTKAIFIGTNKEVRLQVPYLKMDLKQIVKIGIENKFPFELSWLCTVSQKEPCGECPDCKLRYEAFKANQIQDPLSPVSSHTPTTVSFVENRGKIETQPRKVITEKVEKTLPKNTISVKEAFSKTIISEIPKDIESLDEIPTE